MAGLRSNKSAKTLTYQYHFDLVEQCIRRYINTCKLVGFSRKYRRQPFLLACDHFAEIAGVSNKVDKALIES